MEHLTAFIHTLVVHFGYAGLFVVMFLGNMGMPVGTEVVMPTAGALAGSGHFAGVGIIPAWVVVAAVGVLGEVVGATTLYFIGWYGGLPFVRRYGKYVMFREHHLDRVHAFYERYGRSTVFWSRFVPFVRGVASLPAGISRMQKRYFITYSALGSAIFCFGLSYLGELAGHNINEITAYVHDFALVIVCVLVVAVAAGIVVWRMTAARRQRERASARKDIVV